MRFYCSDHGKDVYAPRLPGRVECYTESDIERHYLGEFPSDEFWEYCCDCDTAWRAGSLTTHQPSTGCSRCKSSITVRYLCDRCGVFTLDSDSAFSERTYRLEERKLPISRHDGLDEIACPGCANAPLAEVRAHNCRACSIQYWTAREECPLCEERISYEPNFPSLAADCLRQLANEKRRLVAFDIAQNTFVNAPDGKFVLVANGSAKAVLVPIITRFQSSDVYFVYYSGTYDCDNPSIGDVRILSPAVVDQSDKGWRLRERGRLDILASEEDTAELQLIETSPISVADHLKKVTEKAIVKSDQANGLLVRDPKGQGHFVVTQGEGDSLILLPRLTHFLGRLGFQKYFDDFYKTFYDCAEPSAGDVLIIEPATVRRVKGGWRLTKKGVLEVREEATEPDAKTGRIQNGEQTRSEVVTSPPTAETPSNRVKYFRALIFFVAFVTVTLLIWKLFWVSKPVPQSESLVRIAGGGFVMGSKDGEENERPQHDVTLKPFFIDTYEVTREEYETFVNARNHKAPSGWTNGHYPPNTTRWPVTGVDWYDADAYCKWIGKRLPTEEEWELAAKGLDARKYPWGNDWKSGYANADKASQGLTDVDKFKGASPYGAIGMVGNAWEWTANKLVAYPGGRIPLQEIGDGKVDLRVIRGGSWQSDRSSATTTYRWGWPASGGKDYSNTGFRCVKDAQ